MLGCKARLCQLERELVDWVVLYRQELGVHFLAVQNLLGLGALLVHLYRLVQAVVGSAGLYRQVLKATQSRGLQQRLAFEVVLQ